METVIGPSSSSVTLPYGQRSTERLALARAHRRDIPGTCPAGATSVQRQHVGGQRSSTTDVQSTVFVVDDDISVRESLEALIHFAGWQPRVFAFAHEFLLWQRALAPNCLVLDINLPDLNGLDLQRQLAEDRLEMPIIFLTGYANVPMTVQAMKGGAVEFLTKPFDDEVLLTAIRNALEFSRATLDRAQEIKALQDRHASLSCREQEVMELVVSGLLNKQAGFELGISEITVKAHRGQVMRKMGANSLAELVMMAGTLGLTRPRRSD